MAELASRFGRGWGDGQAIETYAASGTFERVSRKVPVRRPLLNGRQGSILGQLFIEWPVLVRHFSEENGRAAHPEIRVRLTACL